MAKNIEMQYYNGSSYEVCYPKVDLSNNAIGILPIILGGTGASTSDEAIVSLGITPNKIGAADENHIHDGYATIEYVDKVFSYAQGVSVSYTVPNGGKSGISKQSYYTIATYNFGDIGFIPYKMLFSSQNFVVFTDNGGGKYYTCYTNQTELSIVNNGDMRTSIVSSRGGTSFGTCDVYVTLTNTSINISVYGDNTGGAYYAYSIYSGADRLSFTALLLP